MPGNFDVCYFNNMVNIKFVRGIHFAIMVGSLPVMGLQHTHLIIRTYICVLYSLLVCPCISCLSLNSESVDVYVLYTKTYCPSLRQV